MFKVNDKVKINLVGIQGTGSILTVKEDEEGETVYQVAVFTGRFDDHRNADGQLWVNHNEIN